MDFSVSFHDGIEMESILVAMAGWNNGAIEGRGAHVSIFEYDGDNWVNVNTFSNTTEIDKLLSIKGFDEPGSPSILFMDTLRKLD